MIKNLRFGIFISTIILWCLFAGSARAEELVISDEFTSHSEQVSIDQTVVTAEGQFMTALETIVSEELSFQTATTTRIIPVDLLAVSDELSVKTLDEPDNPPPPGGGGGNGGGGNGGSGGGFIRQPFIPSPLVSDCPIYLTKFIKFGAANDPDEVRKLQIFLRDYEQFNSLAITGIYDQATLTAVMVFQRRYKEAILKPWGIDYPTGYVYITTTLAINNLYCERDPANDLDLRTRRGEVELPSIAVPDGRQATTTATTTLPEAVSAGEVGVRDQNLFQLAALGLFDFIKAYPWLWLALILLVLIILLGLEKRKNKNEDS